LPLPCREGFRAFREGDFFLDNLVVRTPFIIVMIGWAGLAPWEFELSFPGSRTSTFLAFRFMPARCRAERPKLDRVQIRSC